MAVAVDAVTTADLGGTPISWSHTCTGSNRVLIVVIPYWADGRLISSITYNGVNLTQIIHHQVSLYAVDIWGLIAPATGSNTITITFAASPTQTPWGTACAVSMTGADQTTAWGTAAGANGSSTGPSVNVSSAANEMVIDGVTHDAASVTPGSGQTERMDATFVQSSFASTEPGAAGTVTMSCTLSVSSQWTQAGVSIKEAVAAASRRIWSLSVRPPPIHQLYRAKEL